MSYDLEDTLESWYVKVTYGMAGDEEWEDEEGEGSRAPAAGTEVGHVILWRLRDDTGDSGCSSTVSISTGHGGASG